MFVIRVRLARERKTEKPAVLKIIMNKKHWKKDDSLSKIKELKMSEFENEFWLLKSLNHPHIGEVIDFQQNGNFYLEDGRVLSASYIATEYFPNGDLFSYVETCGFFSETLSGFYFKQLISALEYLHQTQSITHRDIKLENVVLDHAFNLKLIDFGVAIRSITEKKEEKTDKKNKKGEKQREFSYLCGSAKYKLL